MKIQIEPHTLQSAIERGATENEIDDTLNSVVNILGNQADWVNQKYLRLALREMENILKKEIRSLLCN